MAHTYSLNLKRVRSLEYNSKNEVELIPVNDNCFTNFSVESPIIYWMSRDQRVDDNWALLFARQLSIQHKVGISVIFNLVPSFLEATERQYDFMLKGLQESENKLREKNIPFYLLSGHPKETIPHFLSENKSCILITDFSPLRTTRCWVNDIVKIINNKVKVFCVDAHNIVPVWEASNKQEYAARTIRSKINTKKDEFLTEFPVLEKLESCSLPPKTDWVNANKTLNINRNIKPVDWILPGYNEGMKVLQVFCKNKLEKYVELRNKPTENMLSNLSPYFHFGQIAPQRAVLEVIAHGKSNKKCLKSVECFTEEAMVRRELSENFCFYQKNYDNINGSSQWAKTSLELHKSDEREYIYSLEEFENADTHSEFWNAMQTELISTGKLHGYCRMMWAKNILEWSTSPEEALKISIYLNDKYSLDGRDPNGYVGCMWSIVGIHDQGWRERNIFGKIRYMNEKGCRRKFNVDEYIAKYIKKKKNFHTRPKVKEPERKKQKRN